MSETELIKLSQNGNKSALNTLLSDNYPVLSGYAIKMTCDKTLSQDIVQETMLKAVINISKFKPSAKFSTWLITIATNVYRDYLRKNKLSEPLADDFISASGNIEDSVLARLEYQRVVTILTKLSYEKRAVFILKNYYGYKYEEIAEILKCPIGTVRSRLHNSIEYIIRELEGSEHHKKA